MPELKEKLEKILGEKQKLSPEVLAEGRTCFGVKGTLRHWLPLEIKLVDLKEITNNPKAYGEFNNTSDAICMSIYEQQTYSSLGTYGINKKTGLIKKLSDSRSNDNILWGINNGNFIGHIGNKLIKYDSEFNELETIFESEKRIGNFYDSAGDNQDPDEEPHFGEYIFERDSGKLLLLVQNSCNVYFYDFSTDEVFFINIPDFDDQRSTVILEDNDHMLITNYGDSIYEITLSTRQAEQKEELIDCKWSSHKNVFAIPEIVCLTTSTKTFVKINTGSYISINSPSPETFIKYNNSIYYVEQSTYSSYEYTSKLSKLDLDTGEITTIWEPTDKCISARSELCLNKNDHILYSIYSDSHPGKSFASSGGIYQVNLDTNAVQTSDEIWIRTDHCPVNINENLVVYFDSNKIYKYNSDNTLETLYTLPDYRKDTCYFTDTYDFTLTTNSGNTRDYTLLYTKRGITYWFDDQTSSGTGLFLYDKETNKITSLFTYNGIVLQPSTDGNLKEICLNIKEDSNYIYLCVVPDLGRMNYGRFIGPIYTIKKKVNSFSWYDIVNVQSQYSGAQIGADYMYIGPNIVSNMKEMFEVDAFTNIEDSADYWNNIRMCLG